MLAQQFLPEPGAKSERRSPALLRAETAGTRNWGTTGKSVDMQQKVLKDNEIGEQEQEAME